MFWRKSKKTTTEDPVRLRDEQKVRTELKKRLLALFAANRDSQFTIRHLEAKLAPVSTVTLSVALAELQQAGLIDRIIRVESLESHGGIQDFDSLDELPSEIYDWRTQRTIPVTPDNISLIFKKHEANLLVRANA